MTITKTQMEVIQKLQSTSNNLVHIKDSASVTQLPHVWRVRRTITGSAVRKGGRTCERCGSYNEDLISIEFHFEGTINHEDSEERWRFTEARANRVTFRSITSATKAIDRFLDFQGHLNNNQVRRLLEGSP